ncbi:MAG: HPr family phosphocarrier protein [Tissierellales bacterium]|jgi:phosphotransferase system HPr-like phosphotransfer protein|nr:HPr family phosphocarrier protein [Tissierellales bacterium]
MKAKFIKVEDINGFVEFVSKLNGKVYLQSEEVKVNAKSLIGAMYIINEHPENIVVEVEDETEKKMVLTYLMQGGHLLD